MSKKVLNNPSPNVLMNSMRSIGYSFKTACADIIDNSISANATTIKIYSPINNELYIAFFDNGYGMNRDELLNAMKYGSNRDSYGENDLGRFGLGLKSASLSQCKKLTVVSKKQNTLSAFCWDLDEVLEFKTWDCLELNSKEISELPKIDLFKNVTQGTLVIWQNFDIIYKKSNGHVQEELSEEIEETEKHISLVFHRFLNRHFNPLKIYINEDEIIGIDPFLEEHPKTYSLSPSIMKFRGTQIKIQQFILPYMKDLNERDIEKLGGYNMFRSGQGFYIYRNDRLIIYGTWFRLASNKIDSELYKYGRIKVDIPNVLDDMWDIDIKKQNAAIPKEILNSLKRAVQNVRIKSKEKTTKNKKIEFDKCNNKIWNKRLTRDNKEEFVVNCDSKFVKNFIEEFQDADKQKIIRFLETLSCSIPYDDIYNSMSNRNLNKQMSSDSLESIILEGINQFNYLKRTFQLSDDNILDILKTYEPFDNKKIFEEVKGRINNANKK